MKAGAMILGAALVIILITIWPFLVELHTASCRT